MKLMNADDIPPKGTEGNPIAVPDLPWTALADGWYWFHHRDWNDTHEPRPLKGAQLAAGTVVSRLSPSGTPL